LFGFTELSLVREYHASYYVPHNLALIVAGKLTEGTSSLLRVVQEQVEPRLIQHKQNKGSHPAGWKRPFVETPSAERKPIPATTKSLVEFPEKDESTAFLHDFVIKFLSF
jgi:Zn-dependent M16 (insulinase) family peptidase